MTIRSTSKICNVKDCSEKHCALGLCNKHYRRQLRHGSVLFVKHIRHDNVGRFWSKVQKTPECWLWTDAKSKDGYGTIHIDGLNIKAHRYSFFLHNGHYPKPECRHSCDNPPCVNPAHLLEGTHQENMDDMAVRQRKVPLIGERNGRAVLTEVQVKEIKLRLTNGEICRCIAESYNVTRSTINSIKRGRIWKQVFVNSTVR